MCLILFSYKSHPNYRIILASNRDEFYDRPTKPAAFWDDVPDVIAGRDVLYGGTWLGITKSGRIVALTNYREPSERRDASSRGLLVSNFLRDKEKPIDLLQRLTEDPDKYNGLNLILGDNSNLYYYSNRGGNVQNLSPGLYGLSNHLLNTPWPKVEKSKKAFQNILSEEEKLSPEEFLNLMADTARPDDSLLPDTGVGFEWERILSSVFVSTPLYGTRSSTVVFIDKGDNVTFVERIFDSGPTLLKTTKHEFKIH